MREFIIDRSKWRCGKDGDSACGLGPTQLLNSQGYMCCLGQIACQLNWTRHAINDRSVPSHRMVENKKVNKSILLSLEHPGCSEFSGEAMDINDDEETTRQEKEKALKELGKKYGLKIKFVGKSVKYKKEL